MNWNKLTEVFLEWNGKLNLSAIRDAQGVYEKHILDSLELNNIFKIDDGNTVLDLGTGGGFPLLPLAMSYPNVKFTGLDSTKKKIDAIGNMATQLGIINIELIWARAENHSKEYDIVTARAVAYSDKLMSWARPLVKKGGKLIMYKGLNHEEDNYIQNHSFKHGFRVLKTHLYDLAGTTRVIYIMIAK